MESKVKNEVEAVNAFNAFFKNAHDIIKKEYSLCTSTLQSRRNDVFQSKDHDNFAVVEIMTDPLLGHLSSYAVKLSAFFIDGVIESHSVEVFHLADYVHYGYSFIRGTADPYNYELDKLGILKCNRSWVLTDQQEEYNEKMMDMVEKISESIYGKSFTIV